MSIFTSSTRLTATKARVLNSALQLFVEKGFFNTSIPDLVTHSGVSTGSIYHSFKDKQHLAESLLAELIILIENQQQTILDQHQSCWDQYYHLCKWLLETAESEPQVMQFVIKAQHQEFMPDSTPICSSKPFMTLRDVVQKGMDQGELESMDLMVAASIAFGGVLRLIQLRLDGLVNDPLPTYLDLLTQHSWKALCQPNLNEEENV